MSTELPADDRGAKALRGFGLVGILAILVILAANGLFAPLGAILVLVLARWSRTPWREIGYLAPKSWTLTLAIGIAFGIAFKFLMKSIMMPLLGAAPINQAYHYLAGNTAALPGAIYGMIVVAGFGEETLFRGYMFERFGKLLGSGVWARTFIVLIISVWFWTGPLLCPGARRRRTGDDHGSRVRDDLRDHGPNLSIDGCARRFRPDRARDDLLES